MIDYNHLRIIDYNDLRIINYKLRIIDYNHLRIIDYIYINSVLPKPIMPAIFAGINSLPTGIKLCVCCCYKFKYNGYQMNIVPCHASFLYKHQRKYAGNWRLLIALISITICTNRRVLNRFF